MASLKANRTIVVIRNDLGETFGTARITYDKDYSDEIWENRNNAGWVRVQDPSQGREEQLGNCRLDLIQSIDEQQRVIGFNPAAEALFGCSAGEALGSPLERFVPAWAREKHTEHVRRFSTSEEERRKLRRAWVARQRRAS